MSSEELAKDLGPLAALTIGVGTMIGAGIFVLPGPAVLRAGPLAALAFILGGGIALLTALSASELGTAMPRSGGAYYYINRGLGPLFGSIAGWGNWVGLAFASAFYMYGLGEYVNVFLGAPAVNLVILSLEPAQVIGLGGAIFFIAINYIGAKETGRLQNIIVITLVVILTAFTIVGLANADLSTLRPIDPNGWSPLLPVTGIIFVSFLGFVQITSVAEEIQDPGRNLPRAIIGSVVIVTIIYALVLIVMLAAVETEFIAGNETAVVEAAHILFGRYDILGFNLTLAGGVVLLVGGLLATASSANASILASSRINFAMGRDKLVSPGLNTIHTRFGTPYRSIAVTGGLILIFIIVGNLELLATAGSVLHLLIYGLLNITLIVFRETDPDWYTPTYTIPLYPLVPIAGALLSFGLIAFIEPVVILLCALFVLFAMAWYGLYARSKISRGGLLTDLILDRSSEFPDAAISMATTVQPDADRFRVMVPLANPEHETELITLASAIANQRDGTVVAVHIHQVPDQTSLAAAQVDFEDDTTMDLFDAARTDAETFGVDIETHTVFSHRSFEEIFDAARRFDADMTIIGWGPRSHGAPHRAEGLIEELATSLPCDFLVYRDRGFDPSQILLPTAGGPNADLSAAVARALREEFNTDISLFHAADSRSQARTFLETWATDHDLEDADLRPAEGPVEPAIASAAEHATLLVIGAAGRGVISRLARGSLVLDILDDVDCSVLIAEKRHETTLRERIFGESPDE